MATKASLNPRLATIIPAYNHGRFVDETIASLLEDVTLDVEIVAVDDGSTDDTLQRLEAWARRDKRVRVIRHEDGLNHGVHATLERGITLSRAPMITMIASDDRSLPGRLRRQLEGHARSGARWSYGLAYVIDDEGRRTAPEPRNDAPPQDRSFLGWLLGGQSIYAATVMYERALFDEVGGLGRGRWEDLELCLKFAARSEPLFLNEPLIDYRTHGGSLYAAIVDRGQYFLGVREAIDHLISSDVASPAQREEAAAYLLVWAALDDAAGGGPPIDPRRLDTDRLTEVLHRHRGVIAASFSQSALIRLLGADGNGGTWRRAQEAGGWTSAPQALEVLSDAVRRQQVDAPLLRGVIRVLLVAARRRLRHR